MIDIAFALAQFLGLRVPLLSTIWMLFFLVPVAAPGIIILRQTIRWKNTGSYLMDVRTVFWYAVGALLLVAPSSSLLGGPGVLVGVALIPCLAFASTIHLAELIRSANYPENTGLAAKILGTSFALVPYVIAIQRQLAGDLYPPKWSPFG